MTKHTAHRVAAIDNLASRISTDSPHTRKLNAIVLALRNSVDAIGVLYSRPNPVETQAAQEKRVAKASEKLSAQVKSAQDQINETMQQGSRDIDARIVAKVNLKENNFAAEIRSVFRAMSNTDKIAMLTKLATENKGPEIAAIISAPTVLTGISDEMQMRFQEHIVTLHAPAEHAEQKALMEALDPAWVATRVARDTANDFASPRRLAEIEKREAEAAAAEATFNTSAQS